MAALAAAAKTAVVTIIAAVTAGTIARNVLSAIALVAAAATQPGVGTGKGEICRAVVVEAPQGPGIGRMAAFALLAKRAFMGIFPLVAIYAAALCKLVFMTAVAGLAGCYGVHAFQGKPGQFVVEVRAISPARCLVTTVALAHLLGPVDIVGAVAELAIAA